MMTALSPIVAWSVQVCMAAGSEVVGGYNTQKCCDHSITETVDPVNNSGNCLRFEVRGSDPGLYPHHRAEILPNNQQQKIDQDYGHSWSVFIPDDWEVDSNWTLVAQWHTTGAAMQPLQLQISGNEWCWVNWIGIQPNAEYHKLWCGSLDGVKGKWVDWVVNVRWANDSSGFFNIWKDGSLVVDEHRSNIYEDYSPYWKLGLVYPVYDQVSHVIYIDNVHVEESVISLPIASPAIRTK